MLVWLARDSLSPLEAPMWLALLTAASMPSTKLPMYSVTLAARSASAALPSSPTAMPFSSSTVLPTA